MDSYGPDFDLNDLRNACEYLDLNLGEDIFSPKDIARKFKIAYDSNRDTLADLVRKVKLPAPVNRIVPETPLISIIIPSRVDERLHVMASIERQTYRNLEVIIQYDYYRLGAAAARNIGAQKATGDFILFCDNDIELSPDAIESMLMALQATGAAWAYGRALIDGKIVTLDRPPIPPQNSQSEEFIRYFNGIHTTSLIRSVARPRFDEKMLRFSDWDLWIRLTKAGHKHTFVDKVILKSKNRPGCISTGVVGGWYRWERILYRKHGVI